MLIKNLASQSCDVISLKNEELFIFCGILSDAYRDSYIEASVDVVKLPSKFLRLGFAAYTNKRKQIEARKSIKLHFGCDDKITDLTSVHDRLFEHMKEALIPFDVIHNGLELKKAYWAWTWLLQSGVYLPDDIQNRLLPLKVQVNNAPMSKSDKKCIAIQAMAQVIGYRNESFKVQKIKDIIVNWLSFSPTIFRLSDWNSIKKYKDHCGDEDIMVHPANWYLCS